MFATNSNRAVLRREQYAPFGEKLEDPAGNQDDRGYIGHVQDAATGLTYMQARYYDPTIGRFLSVGPVGFASGGVGYLNRYAYVGNDPINARIRPENSPISSLAVLGERLLERA